MTGSTATIHLYGQRVKYLDAGSSMALLPPKGYTLICIQELYVHRFEKMYLLTLIYRLSPVTNRTSYKLVQGAIDTIDKPLYTKVHEGSLS